MRFDSGLLIHSGEIEGYPQIDEWGQTAAFLESAGFTGLWCAEHHFFWDGWTHPTPTNPLLFGAFMASRTTRLRLGQCGVCLPDWHPLHVAEDVAMLDHMTRGRVDFGFIRGLNNRTAGNFNPDADRRDQERNRALFWESFEIVRKALAGGPFSHQGEFYTVPQRGWVEQPTEDRPLDPRFYSPEGELIALEINPRPYQEPLPMWLMADSFSTTAEGAERGLGVISWGQSFERTREALGLYRNALAEGAEERVAIMRPVFVGRTREEAEAVMRPAINLLMENIVGKTPSWGSRKAFLATDEEISEADLDLDWFDFLDRCGWCLVGTPAEVAEKLGRFESELGCHHIVNYWAIPLIRFDQMMASQRLFADEVMPRFSSSNGNGRPTKEAS
jgi:alkanesulfonate monooxygenase SsuD/methylene tetrahydromethanopterin reductase-like flavin-dependent oxidoreductase (luciferase family)